VVYGFFEFKDKVSPASMKRRSLLLCLMFSLSLPSMATAYGSDWTEKKLGAVIIKADKAARHNKWARAISFGEQAVSASRELDRKYLSRYINLLKNLNSYYDQAGRLDEVPQRVEEAYRLSSEHLGRDHPTTIKCRALYYKILIANSRYQDAIPLMKENIETSRTFPQAGYEILKYLSRLASLYALTDQFAQEEATLLELLNLNTRLFGKDDKDNIKTVRDLANNYCRQRKFAAFDKLMKDHDLKYVC